MCPGIAKTDPLLVDVIHDSFRLLVREVHAQYGVDVDSFHILSDRKDHLELLLAEIASIQTDNKKIDGFLITSDTGKRMRKQIMEEIKAMRARGEEFPFLLSTGSLIGEGFDLPELCTLVLAMPLSFRGRLVQYAGRLHRESAEKKDFRIYDYVDVNLGLGITMFRKRMVTYRKMGYSIEIPADSTLNDIVGRKR